MESEKKTEAYLCERVKRMGGRAYKFVSPGNIGVPDRIIVLPGGVVFFAELKSPAGKLTANQSLQIERLRKLGHNAYVIKNRDQVNAILETEGAI